MDPASFDSQFYRGRTRIDPSIREVGAPRRRVIAGTAAGLDSFPARSYSHPVSGNYVGGRPFRPSDNSSVGRQLNNYNGGSDGGALAWNHEPVLPTGLHRRRNHHYPPPPAMQGARSRRFHPRADLPYLRMLPEDGVAILDISNYQVGDLSESSSGLSEESITNSLKTRICQKVVVEEEDDDDDCCVICMDEYQNEEKMGFLDCGHEYHAHCLNKWLLRKNVCPICKAPAITSL